MSQSDEPVDPYRMPPPQAGPVPPPQGYQAYPSPQGYQGLQGYPPADGSLGALQARRPPSVTWLLKAMTAGAVVAALQGVYGLLTVDTALQEVRADLDQAAVDSGVDVETLAGIASTTAVVVSIASLIISVGLWLLFARLFSRGQARVLGTVLGAVNGLGSLFGLLSPVSAVSLLLNLVVLAAVVAGLVLLWLPTTSAWFAAMTAARRRPAWG